MDKTVDGTDMTDLFFNELSCVNLQDIEIDRIVSTFALVAKEAKEQGVGHIRFEKGMEAVYLSYNLNLRQYCIAHSKEDTIRLLLKIQDAPYLSVEKETLIDRYIESTFRLICKDGDVDTYGLACAYLSDAVSIGFSTPGWEKIKYTLVITNSGGREEKDVLCMSTTEHIDSIEFSTWADTHLPLPILHKSRQIPLDKKCHIPQHHGKDILDCFSKKLLKCPYVEEIITSVERDSKSSRFVEEIYEDNTIIVRLINQGGFAIKVLTTAKNRRQLRTIASYIQANYYQ